MSCTDPWVIEQRLRDAAKEETYESSFAGIQEDNLLTIDDLNGGIIGLPSDGVIAAAPQGEWLHMTPPTSFEGYEDCSEIHINGKSYLMIDNSGPEEMNPHKLQAQIVEMRKELEDTLHTLQETTEGVSLPEPTNSIDFGKAVFGAIEQEIERNYEYGALGNSEETERMTIGEMADSITFSGYGGYGGYYAPCEFNLADVSLVNETLTPGAEVKLVSQEEVDYERAMSMIGK